MPGSSGAMALLLLIHNWAQCRLKKTSGYKQPASSNDITPPDTLWYPAVGTCMAKPHKFYWELQWFCYAVIGCPDFYRWNIFKQCFTCKIVGICSNACAVLPMHITTAACDPSLIEGGITFHCTPASDDYGMSAGKWSPQDRKCQPIVSRVNTAIFQIYFF